MNPSQYIEIHNLRTSSNDVSDRIECSMDIIFKHGMKRDGFHDILLKLPQILDKLSNDDKKHLNINL